MIFQTIDYISPKITFYYKGKHRHNSRFGGVLTITMIFIIIILAFSYSIDIIFHRKPFFLFHKKYINDVKYHSFNENSHFFWSNNKIDFESIRIIMLNTNFQNNDTKELANIEHWVYDKCSNNNNDRLNEVCVNYYYNNRDKIYYKIDDKNFKKPYLEHGLSNPNNILLETRIEKCSNDSVTKEIFGLCKNEKEIFDYIENNKNIYLKLVNNQIDLNNFNTPIQTYYYNVDAKINITYEIYYYSILFRYSQNYLFETYKETENLSFNENYINKGASYNITDKNILYRFYFFIENYQEIFQRKYYNLFDVLPKIGGIIQFLYYIFYYLNYLCNRFILVNDTQVLFLGKDETEFPGNNMKISPTNLLLNIRRSLTVSPNLLDQIYKPCNIKKNNDNRNIMNKNTLAEKILGKNNENFNDPKKKISLVSDFSDLNLLDLKNNLSKNHFNEIDDSENKNKIKYNSCFFNSNLVNDKGSNKNKNYQEKNKDNFIENNGQNYNSIMQGISPLDKNPNNINRYFSNKINRKIITKVKSGVSLYDIFASANYPMLEYFNFKLKENGKNNQEFFSKKIKFYDYIYYLCKFKKHYCNIKILEKFHRKLLSEEYLYHSHILLYTIHKSVFDRSEKAK